MHARWVELFLDRLVFLDAQTLKITFAAPEPEWRTSPDFRWATRTRDGEVWIAPLLVPTE